MANMFSVLVVLLLITYCRAQQGYVESRQIPLSPMENGQQGPGYSAKVSVYHNPPMSQQQGQLQYQPMSNNWGHSQPQQPATFQGVVDKISQGLLDRKKLPHELEREHAEMETLNIERLHSEMQAKSDRRQKAQELLDELRHRRIMAQHNKHVPIYDTRHYRGPPIAEQRDRQAYFVQQHSNAAHGNYLPQQYDPPPQTGPNYQQHFRNDHQHHPPSHPEHLDFTRNFNSYQNNHVQPRYYQQPSYLPLRQLHQGASGQSQRYQRSPPQYMDQSRPHVNLWAPEPQWQQIYHPEATDYLSRQQSYQHPPPSYHYRPQPSYKQQQPYHAPPRQVGHDPSYRHLYPAYQQVFQHQMPQYRYHNHVQDQYNPRTKKKV